MAAISPAQRILPVTSEGQVHLQSRSVKSLGAGVLGAVATLVLAVAPLCAQTTSTLTGRVMAGGRPVAEAQIAVTDRETNQVRGTRTSAELVGVERDAERSGREPIGELRAA